MKKIFTLLTIACMVFTGCTDDDMFGKKGGYTPAKPGDEIAFGGSMTYESAKRSNQTRTVYGDKLSNGTEIKWLAGDKVRIYCDQAYVDPTNPADVKYCDYSVTGAFSGAGQITGNGDDDAYETCSLERYSAVGLRWGEESIDGHYFFGVYPSPEQFNESQDLDAKSKLKIEADASDKSKGKLTAHLPALQYPARYVAKSGTTYTMHPAMRYAYMVGAAKANPSDGGVDMLFVPVVAAVEMTLVNNGDASVEDIEMITLTSTDGKAICGNFTTTIAMDAKGVTDITNSVNNNAETSNEYQSVSVPTYHLVTNDNTTTTEMVDLAVGESIKFTLFMLLDDDDAALDKLTVSLRAGGITKSAQVSGVDIVQAKKKNFLHGVGVIIQNQITLDYSKWMESLDELYDPDTYTLAPLSVPGAGGAWSGNYTTTTAADGTVTKNYTISDPMYRQQNLNFEELWDCGIRCFEAQVDWQNEGGFLGVGGTPHVNNMNIYCNGQSTGVKFSDALKQLRQKVYANKDSEFAFLIVTYYEQSGVSSRNSGNWQKAVHSDLDALQETAATSSAAGLCGVKLWTPDMTITDARGNLLIIARPSTIGVDYGWHGLGTSNTNILSILGWGSMPDQWYARGFGTLENYSSKKDDYNASSSTYWGSVSPVVIPENVMARPFMYEDNNNYAYTYNEGKYSSEGKDDIESNFGYYATTTTTLFGGLRTKPGVHGVWDNHNAYVQEWRRVVKEDVTTDDGYFWKSNIDEKWDDIVSCLRASMEDVGRENYEYYINSLCGFFVDPDIELSYKPSFVVQRYGTAADNIKLDCKYYDGPDYSVINGGSILGINVVVSNYDMYHANAGDAGDIATYASWVNGKFYSYLQGLMTSSGGLGGKPTGIVLMDRVSNTTDDMAGLNIARIIIANNFENTNTAESASVMRLSFSDELDLDATDGNQDKLAAPEKR